MPKKQTKRAAADAAYLKTETLRGQIDAFDGVHGATTDRTVIEDYGQSAPPVCPHCGVKTVRHFSEGGMWTHLHVWEEGHRLQCNNCGGIVRVTVEVWQDVRELAIRSFVDRSPNTTAREKRKKLLDGKPTRGAE